MKLIGESKTAYFFETDSGARWSREKLAVTNKSVELKDWKHARRLFVPSESDLSLFPDADYRMELTGDREQNDPLFMSVPVRIKPGTKTVLQIFNDDWSVEEHRIRKMFVW